MDTIKEFTIGEIRLFHANGFKQYSLSTGTSFSLEDKDGKEVMVVRKIDGKFYAEIYQEQDDVAVYSFEELSVEAIDELFSIVGISQKAKAAEPMKPSGISLEELLQFKQQLEKEHAEIEQMHAALTEKMKARGIS